jgi:uncharacterized protein YqjF (DUF2071 family)
LALTEHRPWPLPSRPWIGRQSWHDLLFAHWPVRAAHVHKFVPRELEIDQHDGTSWVGLVPFRMRDVMVRGLPALPWISAFPELNVRLYVRYRDRPGVWFLSLDATNPLAVWAARRFFHLPYRRASMQLTAVGEGVEYRSRHERAVFEGAYRPVSGAFATSPGTLEHWLTERYCFFAQSSAGQLWTCDVHHAPWPLQRAEAEIRVNTLLSDHGLPVPDCAPLLHFARRLDVVAWRPERLSA